MNTTVAGNMTSIKVGRFGLILGGLGANVIDRGARQVLCHIAARALTCDGTITLLQIVEATPAQGKSDAALLAAIQWIMRRESVAPEVRQLARVIEGQVAGLLKRRAAANEEATARQAEIARITTATATTIDVPRAVHGA